MRIVLDTNVLVSGIFFGGTPGRILNAWHGNRVQFVFSAEILDEYRRVGHLLNEKRPGVDFQRLLTLLTAHSEVVEAAPLSLPISSDPDDDKFLTCATSAGVSILVSGDIDLLEHSGWRSLRILKPRPFVDEFKLP